MPLNECDHCGGFFDKCEKCGGTGKIFRDELSPYELQVWQFMKDFFFFYALILAGLGVYLVFT